MKPIEIKILMIRAGVRQADIGRKLGLTRSFINQVILGHRPTRRVRQAIAQAVGKPVEKLWPSKTVRSNEFGLRPERASGPEGVRSKKLHNNSQRKAA